MLKAVNEFQQRKEIGMFIDSCFVHCQTEMEVTWHSPNSPKINDKVTIVLALHIKLVNHNISALERILNRNKKPCRVVMFPFINTIKPLIAKRGSVF